LAIICNVVTFFCFVDVVVVDDDDDSVDDGVVEHDVGVADASLSLLHSSLSSLFEVVDDDE
jgi:hypothetical protein